MWEMPKSLSAGALQSDGSVCLERCRSHITQKKGELTDWEIGQIQDGGLSGDVISAMMSAR